MGSEMGTASFLGLGEILHYLVGKEIVKRRREGRREKVEARIGMTEDGE